MPNMAAPNTNLYVSRLPLWVQEDWLRLQFQRFGLVLSCKVFTKGPTGPKGIGFVQFTTPESAARAQKEMDQTRVGTNCISVRFAHRDKDKGIATEPSNNVYVCNLNPNDRETELFKLFSPFGAIESLIVLEDRKTGSSKCAGLVRFVEIKDASAAVDALNGLVLGTNTRPLEVKFAENSHAKEMRQKDRPRSNSVAPPNDAAVDAVHAAAKQVPRQASEDHFLPHPAAFAMNDQVVPALYQTMGNVPRSQVARHIENLPNAGSKFQKMRPRSILNPNTVQPAADHRQPFPTTTQHQPDSYKMANNSGQPAVSRLPFTDFPATSQYTYHDCQSQISSAVEGTNRVEDPWKGPSHSLIQKHAPRSIFSRGLETADRQCIAGDCCVWDSSLKSKLTSSSIIASNLKDQNASAAVTSECVHDPWISTRVNPTSPLLDADAFRLIFLSSPPFADHHGGEEEPACRDRPTEVDVVSSDDVDSVGSGKDSSEASSSPLTPFTLLVAPAVWPEKKSFRDDDGSVFSATSSPMNVFGPFQSRDQLKADTPSFSSPTTPLKFPAFSPGTLFSQ